MIRFDEPKAPRVQPERYINMHSWYGPNGQCSFRVYELTDGSWYGETKWADGCVSHRILPERKEPASE